MQRTGTSLIAKLFEKFGCFRLAGLGTVIAFSMAMPMLLFINSNAYGAALDNYCKKHPTAKICASTPAPTPTPDPGPTPTPTPTGNSVSEVKAVPYLSDETATYTFNSKQAGAIVYGGTCGNADKSQAVAGDNKITWTLREGSYSNCTIKVGDSSTLAVPAFKSTSHYPVVFVHGLSGSASGWNNARSYLEGQGWDSSLLIAKSITVANSTMCGASSPDQASLVADWVDDALEQFPGFDKVDLVGHSRGGSNIMRALWHGFISPDKVRYVVTLAGANRNCEPYYPAIPSDETPGSAKYSAYYSDGNPDNDSAVDYSNTNVKGAYMQNLYPLSHSEMKSATTALQALKNSLLGTVGGN
jgi:triacylglycerol lipase